MGKSTVERRAHARFPRKFELEGTESGNGEIARMIASDLSLGGLYCYSATDYPEMTRLAVRLMLPAHRSGGSNPLDKVDLEAIVVRRRKARSAAGDGRFELALFFTSMSDGAREKIARFLAHPAS